MARVKNLEKQLNAAKNGLLKAEAEVKNYKNKISEIENMIEKREKENIYLLIKDHGLTISDLQKLLSQSKNTIKMKDNKKSQKEDVA